jgi:GNAT superfamily N-acetyltransferase
MQLFESNSPRAGLARPTTERLPFTIRRATDSEALHKAVRVRHAAYARHVPEFARTLAQPEACDFDEDCVVLLAESRLDGTPLGTLRIQTNHYQPLPIEASVTLPAGLQGRVLAEVTRLGVGEGRIGSVVKLALMKALFEYCEEAGVEWMIATGRAPIDRQYEQLLFQDVFGPGELVPLRHVGNIPHRVMAFEVPTAEARWRAAGHPLIKFFRETSHPDIDIGLPARPLSRPAPAALRPTRIAELAAA